MTVLPTRDTGASSVAAGAKPEGGAGPSLLRRSLLRVRRHLKTAGTLIWPPAREEWLERRVFARTKDEEVSIDWEPWMDGRLHRLQHRKHFRGPTPEVATDAFRVAGERGKAVAIDEDRIFPNALWVQFFDGEHTPGEACVCGSMRFVKSHDRIVRCSACNRHLLLAQDAAAGGKVASQKKQSILAATSLDGYDGVRLMLVEKQKDFERYAGYGYRALEGASTSPQLLSVEFPCVDAERIPNPSVATGYAHRVASLAMDDFEQLVELDTLLERPEEEWDIALE